MMKLMILNHGTWSWATTTYPYVTLAVVRLVLADLRTQIAGGPYTRACHVHSVLQHTGYAEVT